MQRIIYASIGIYEHVIIGKCILDKMMSKNVYCKFLSYGNEYFGAKFVRGKYCVWVKA